MTACPNYRREVSIFSQRHLVAVITPVRGTWPLGHLDMTFVFYFPRSRYLASDLHLVHNVACSPRSLWFILLRNRHTHHPHFCTSPPLPAPAANLGYTRIPTATDIQPRRTIGSEPHSIFRSDLPAEQTASIPSRNPLPGLVNGNALLQSHIAGCLAARAPVKRRKTTPQAILVSRNGNLTRPQDRSRIRAPGIYTATSMAGR